MSRPRWASTVAVVFAIAAALAASGQEPQMPEPGPEHKAMDVFAGKWSFEGEAKEGPFGPGGEISFTETCEWFEGGFALVCRSQGQGPMGPAESLSIMSYDPQKEAYTYYSVESSMPPFTAIGKHEGKTWQWQSEMKAGDEPIKTRVTITETSPKTHTFLMEASTDGSTWMRVMEGTSTKSST